MPIDILMYHYVRNNEEYDYDVYCRRKSEFEDQVNFIKKNFKACSIYDVDEINFYLNSEERSFIFTFDDGYKEHLYCAKYLASEGLAGIFFPSFNIFKENLLDVNIIHLLLGKKDINKMFLIKEIQSNIKELNLEINSIQFNYIGNSVEDYINKIDNTGLDDITTTAIKLLLQRDINNEEKRSFILESLFKKVYQIGSKEYAKKYYLSTSDIQEIYRQGSRFGSHCLSHNHLNYLSKESQEYEITKSFEKLKCLKLINNQDIYFLAYPYGAYNKETIEILNNKKIDYAFTIEAKEAQNQTKESKYKLPRWDTNDWWNSKFRRPEIPF